VIQVLALAGDSTLGGEDFDGVVVSWCQEEVRDRHGGTVRHMPADRLRLKEAAEQAKKDLSQQEVARVLLPYLFWTEQCGLTVDLTTTRTEFERRSAGPIDRFRSLLVRVLEQAKCKPASIDDVLLVGGMMHMPRLRELVREVFGREPSGVAHSPEAVARGAAVQGAQCCWRPTRACCSWTSRRSPWVWRRRTAPLSSSWRATGVSRVSAARSSLR
jgi:molecular chaperone DnaK